MIFYLQYLRKIIAVSIALYHVYSLAFGRIEIYTHRVISVLSIELLILLTTSSSFKSQSIKRIADVITFLLWGLTTIYFFLNNERILSHVVGMSPYHLSDVIMGVIFFILIHECSRRVAGIWLPLCSLFFVAYVFMAPYIPGLFHRPPIELTDFIERLVFSTDGIFGFPVAVASTYVFLFALFGQFLNTVGGGQFFFDFASAIAGNAKGGPAKVAVISSGLFGMISGSPVADVATTGSFTIPSMKKAGMPGVYAAAVEAVASCGGSLMPPVMGSVAFLMADILGVPYTRILTASIFPALIYFASLYLMVHLQAHRLNLPRFKKEDLVSFRKVMAYSGAFFLPLFTIAILLLRGYTAIRAALGAIIACVLVGILLPQPGKDRLNLKQVFDSLEQGSVANRPVNSACAVAGVIAGVIFFTGVGGKVGSSIMVLSQESLLPALILAMLTSIIIGLGISVSATYIIVALLVVPAAVNAGVPPLAAHFFVFQYGILSHITPPVAVPPYVAAGIAGEDPMKCSFAAWYFGLITFFIPFLYVYEPGLLLIGTAADILRGVCKAAGAVVLIDCAIVGYMLTETRAIERLLCVLGGMAMLYSGITVPSIGFALGLVVFASQMSRRLILKRKVK
ncbi:TRAP transporter permease [Thermodesulfobacteriota bacterium]